MTDPVIVIGKTPDDWMWPEVRWDMHKLGWTNLIAEIDAGNVEFFDMTSMPEKGDAVEHITPETPLIVALHLYGMSPGDRYDIRPAGYMYNQDNHIIYILAREWDIPLMVVGDQPDSRSAYTKETLSRQYFTDRAS